MRDVPTNPYRYQSEIQNEEFFTGRKEELEEVEYLLSLTDGDRPVYHDFSVIGPSGVGKSSFNQQVKNIAEKSNILTIQLDLNGTENFAKNDLFGEIYRKIVSKIDIGKLKSYKEAIKSITDEVEVDAQIARVVASPSDNSDDIDNIPKDRIVETLEQIYDKKFSDKNAILIIIDNIKNIQSIDTIRNLYDVFSDVSGYCLLLSGDINSFSQGNNNIHLRQVDTRIIELDRFSSVEQTESVVKKPLSSSIEEELTEKTIDEIHQLTDGNPYEINLLAFYMYYHYEKENIDSLVLAPEVVRDAAKQISTTNTVEENKILNKIKDLDEMSIKILIPLVEAPSMPEDWLVQYSSLLFFDSTTTSQLGDLQDSIRRKISLLIEKNIIQETEDDHLELNSNLYTSAFIKYYTLTLGVVDNFSVIGNHLQSNTANIKNSLVSNIHYRLVDATLLDNFEAHSHYNLLDETGVRLSYSERLVDSMDMEVSTHSDGPILPERITTVNRFESFYTDPNIIPLRETTDTESSSSQYDEDQTLRFRCSIDWLDTTYLVTVHSHDENNKSRIKRHIRSVEEQLNDFGISIEYETSRDYVEKGLAEFNNSDYEAAVKKFDKALEINPNNYDAMYYRSYSNYHLSEFKLALEDINNTIRMNNDWTDAQYLKGVIHVERSEYQKAADAFGNAASLCPNNTDLREHLCCLLDREQPSIAIKYGESAIRQGVDDYHVHYHLVIAYMEAEEYDDGIKIANKIINNSSEPAQISRVKLMKASMLEDRGKIDDAVTIYDDVLENSEDPYSIRDAHYERGVSLSGDDPEQAIEDLNEYLERVKDVDSTGNDSETPDLSLYNPGGGGSSETVPGDVDKALYYRGASKLDMGLKEEGLNDLKQAASGNEEITKWVQEMEIPELGDSLPTVRNLQDGG